MTKKAFASLSYEARSAIESWESSNWIGGPLEKHVIANDAVAQEIEQAFQPVRDSIPGDTVRLYRGVQHSDAEHTRHLKDRVLESWTSERAVAEYFAGLRTDQNKQGRSRIIKLPTMQDIDNAVQNTMPLDMSSSVETTMSGSKTIPSTTTSMTVTASM